MPGARDLPHYNLRKFDPTKVKNDAIWVILGPRNTGKTELLVDLLFHTRSNFDFAMAMTFTTAAAERLGTFIPKRLIYTNGFDLPAAEKFLNITQEMQSQHKLRHCALIADDVMADSAFMNTKTVNHFAMDGRHAKQSHFLTSQFPTSIPPKFRSNADVVIALRNTTHADRRRLYEYYFGCFVNLKDFERVFEACTDDFGCLVIDKTSPDQSVEGCIRYYKANPQLVQPFRLGRQIFFQLSDYVDQLNEQRKRSKDRPVFKVI